MVAADGGLTIGLITTRKGSKNLDAAVKGGI
jgi:hypothetical protein